MALNQYIIQNKIHQHHDISHIPVTVFYHKNRTEQFKNIQILKLNTKIITKQLLQVKTFNYFFQLIQQNIVNSSIKLIDASQIEFRPCFN